MRVVRALGQVAAALLTLAVGVAAAASLLAGTVAPACPSYDDEGRTAAPGSAYGRSLCGVTESGTAFATGGAVVVGLALVVAALVVVTLRRRPARAVAGALLGLLLTPPLLVLALHLVLPEDCRGGPDGSSACERDRELL